MNRQVSNIGMTIEKEIQKIEEDIIFDISTGILNINDNDNLNIKRFFGKYSNVVESITIYNDQTIIKYSITESNHLNRVLFTNEEYTLTNDIEYNYSDHKKTIKVPYTNRFGILEYNFIIEVNYNEVIKDGVGNIYINGEYWTWFIDNKENLEPISYSETKNVNARFRLTFLDEIIEDLNKGYKGLIQNNVAYGNIENVSTSYYPIHVGDETYGIGVSVFTMSLIKDITYKVSLLSFFFIILIAQVVIYFNYLIDKEKKISAELNESEETIRRIIVNVPFGIVLYDDEEVLEKNTYAREELNIHKGKFKNKPYEDLFVHEDINEEIIIKINDNGKDRWILKKLTTIKFNKEPVNFISFIDVTLINRAKELAEESSRAKTRFLTMVSHEVRTPLNGIIAATDLLEDTSLNTAEAEEYIATVKQSSISLLSMINDILEMSKIESGRITVNSSWIQLEEIVNSVYNQMKPLVRSKPIDYSLSYDEEIPKNIWTDENKMRQVLINLIGNAIKFTHEGHILVKIDLKEKKETTVLIGFRVIDTGIGIPEDQLESVFDKFVQVEDDNNRKYQGSGLGTTITRELLTLLGSEINVFSPNITFDENLGSEFIFDLEVKYKNNLVEENHEQIVDGTDLKVLLADDNHVNAKISKRILENFGFDVTVVNDGQAAVDAFDHSFDLILMDIQMPIKDGFEATCEIRQLSKEVIIIALTANDVETVNNDGADCGINGIIEKPFTKEKVKKIIKNLNN
ncbi:MAG TPA: response regulator [Clostridia bacterium]|nr:response regulator [Clostridia bacterium]